MPSSPAGPAAAPKKARAAALAAAAVIALAACSGGSDGDGGGSAAPSTTAAVPGGSTSPRVAGPSLVPTGTVGPLSADSDALSIIATANEALRLAPSFLYTATSVTSGGTTTVTSLQVAADGTAMGTITTGASVTGIRIKDLDMWVTGPTGFWSEQLKLGSGGQAVVAGKWVKTSRANAYFAAFSYSASTAGVAEQVFASLQDATLTKTGTVEIDGAPAIGINDNAGSIYYVALNAPYQLLKIEPDPAKAGTTATRNTVAITQWGAPVPFEPPPADQVIAFDSIPKG